MLKHRFSTFSQYPLGIGFLTLFRKVIFLCYHPKHLLFPRIYGDDEVSAVVSKAIESKHAGLDIKTICFLREKGFPDSFIDYLGGTSID